MGGTGLAYAHRGADTSDVPFLSGGAEGVAGRVLAAAAGVACAGTVLAYPAWPAGAETGSIGGQVQVVTKSSRRLASPGAYPSRIVGIAGDPEGSELSNVVVYVKTTAAGAAPTRATIRQTNEAFVPHLVAITTGSTVEFPNDDLIFHNVFSLSRAGTFDLGRYPRGRSKSRTFTEPGLVKVYCHLHSHMSALVRVFDHPHFAIPDAQGRFTIAGLTPREYDVVAWHERAGEVTHQATVTAGRAAALSFALPLSEIK